MEAILAETDVGGWAAFETALLVARQNGKGEIILVLELAGLFLLGEMLLLHSAHEFKTSKEAYLRIKGVIEGAPHLSRLVKQFRQSNEDTSVELMSGARLRFMARSRQSGRGFSAQRLLVDEAQILSRASMGALMPTLSAQENPQINYFGTVPSPADDAEHFTDLRDRGRGGVDPYLAWLEWNFGEECDDLDDQAAWAAGNPTLGYRINELFVAKERASLADADFARERLSIWPSGDAVVVPKWGFVSEAEWDRRATNEKREKPGWLADPVSLGVAMPVERDSVCIAAAGSCREGGIGIEIVGKADGVDWVVGAIVALKADTDHPIGSVVIDPKSPAGTLIRPLTEAGVAVTEIKYADLVKATGDFYDGAGGMVHRDRAELNTAMGLATLRTAGDSVLLDRRAGADVSPVDAAILARYGHLEVPPVEVEAGYISASGR